MPSLGIARMSRFELMARQPGSSIGVLVNVGCGPIYHPDWLNFDVTPSDEQVHYLDVRKGLPLQQGSVDACFSSHVIEHLTPAAAEKFLLDQRRVLKPGGILRVVCPDLAEICQTYLSHYAATRSSGTLSFRHRHLVAELVDQMVRSHPGGELAALWRQVPSVDNDWVQQRMGYVAELAMDIGGRPIPPRESWLRKVRARVKTPRAFNKVATRLRDSALCFIARLMGGSEFASRVRDGLFKASGEQHLWMWDEFTLGTKLTELGFEPVVRREAGESEIPNWGSYNLEIRDGSVMKPNSLILEAKKSHHGTLSSQATR